jgi:sulfate transport system substrate-binding protein
VNNPQLMAEQKDRFPQTELFNVKDAFGGWDNVMKVHFASDGELDKLLAAGRG